MSDYQKRTLADFPPRTGLTTAELVDQLSKSFNSTQSLHERHSSEWFQQGVNDFNQGITDCPYLMKEAGQVWKNGWKQGELDLKNKRYQATNKLSHWLFDNVRSVFDTIDKAFDFAYLLTENKSFDSASPIDDIRILGVKFTIPPVNDL